MSLEKNTKKYGPKNESSAPAEADQNAADLTKVELEEVFVNEMAFAIAAIARKLSEHE